MRITFLFILISFNIFHLNESARILAIFTVPSRSHSILAFELFKELVKSGHEVSVPNELIANSIFYPIHLVSSILFKKVTVISPVGNEMKNPPTNYTNIVILEEVSDQFKGKFLFHVSGKYINDLKKYKFEVKFEP